VNTWYIDNLKGRTFKTASELAEAINREAGCFSANIKDYVYFDGRIATVAEVNNDNEEPSDLEYEQWKRGELTLYVAHLFCDITMVPTGYEHDMTEEEAEAFGIPIY
jgi:hypothetical protein